MCGIIGILGNEPAAPRLVDALKRLEYRGYDSAGIATIDANEDRLALVLLGGVNYLTGQVLDMPKIAAHMTALNEARASRGLPRRRGGALLRSVADAVEAAAAAASELDTAAAGEPGGGMLWPWAPSSMRRVEPQRPQRLRSRSRCEWRPYGCPQPVHSYRNRQGTS